MERGQLDDCRLSVRGSEISLGNDRIRRVWRISAGIVRPVALEDPATGRNHLGRAAGPTPAFLYSGYLPVAEHPLRFHPMGLVRAGARAVRRSLLAGPHLLASLEFEDPSQGLSIRMEHMVFPGVPVVRSVLWVRADHSPRGPFFAPGLVRAVDVLPLAPGLSRWATHEFLARTDAHHEGLRRRRAGGIPRGPQTVEGNVAILERPDGSGFFVLREHPPREDQRPEVDGGFRMGDGELRVLGWGIAPWEFRHDRYRKTYGWAVGVFSGGADGAIRAIKAYQDARYVRIPERDDQFMANPWGSPRCSRAMSERFVHREIRAAASLGIPIYQPDAGWQKWHEPRYANRVAWNLALPRDGWEFHPRRFPRGFAPVARGARALGVRLGLWYSPDLHRQFRTWREEAARLLALGRRFGIRIFKIDTVRLRSKDGEENLERLLRAVFEGSQGRVSFNLDLTAAFRWGYFQLLEYGNVFLENRYTHWGNYWPWRTLRNLWLLSPFVPTRKLQIEVPDVETGTRFYAGWDPTRPAAAGQAYAAAVALFACPLFWGESSALSPRGQAALAPLVALWRRIRGDVLSGQVWPIGDEPDGRSFPGFQSIGLDGRGVAIFYREHNPRSRHEYVLRDVPPGRYRVTPLRPEGEGTVLRVGQEARIVVPFDRPHDARVVRYERA